jgi:hypothetical protein
MNWIARCRLAEIAEDINAVYSSKRSIIHDADIAEDLLSIELVRSIREALITPRDDREMLKDQNGFHLSLQAYKATGDLERKHGDIAIVVYDHDSGKLGTGFYEAKLQSLDGTYPTFRLRQIQKLESNTPRLAIVMHEREKRPVSDDPFDRGFPKTDQDGYPNNLSLCRVLQANWARNFKRLSDATYERHPYSFGYHFVTRYLSGLDLDYARSPAKAIDRWVRTTKGASPLIVEIRISKSDDGYFRNEPVLIAPASSPVFLKSTDISKTIIQPEFIPTI